MTNFDVCIINFDRSVEIRRTLPGRHYTTPQTIWATGLIWLTIVSLLPDFAISLACTIASHIKVTTVFLHCVSSAASFRKFFNSWGTLLSRPLCRTHSARWWNANK